MKSILFTVGKIMTMQRKPLYRQLLMWFVCFLISMGCDPEAVERFTKNDEPPVEDNVEYMIQSDIALQFMQAEGAEAESKVSIAPLSSHAIAQRWILSPLGDDFYTIKSEFGKVLDVVGGGTAPGTLVQIFKSHDHPAQKWKLIKQDDFYYIQSKLGTYLEVQGGRGSGKVHMAEFNGLSAQRWRLQKIESTKKMTSFKPEVHGYKFENDFKVNFSLLGLNAEFGGQCGGMVYSSLDYFNTPSPIPTQTFRPAASTPLARYIFERQMTSVAGNLDKWTELITNPFGWRTDEFFRWGLEGTRPGDRISELKSFIDAGKPVPLGLFKAGDGGFGAHHQVLAIGYDMRRYKGDFGDYKEDFRIFIYDPNHPLQTVTLVADAANNTYYYTEYDDEQWMTYFVDSKYGQKQAPNIIHDVLPNDGLVRKLLLEIETGGDGLRGGNDNVHAYINFTDGSSQEYLNINNLASWPKYYLETVELTLTTPVPLSRISSITLKTTFGGLTPDNWHVDSFRVVAMQGEGISSIPYEASGTPLVIFSGDNIPFVATFGR